MSVSAVCRPKPLASRPPHPEPPAAAHGLDVDENGIGTVVAPRMYQLIRQQQAIVDRLIEIAFIDPGARVYDFTFG
ncbi:MAG TPA: hypothetical protein VGI23_13235 [Steroidobacteraceae bacterium]